MIADAWVFNECYKLKHIDLVGGIYETVAALLLEEWKRDMNEGIDSINKVLPKTPSVNFNVAGGKAMVIRAWIRSVLCKITHYKAEHQRYLNMAAALDPALPNDIVLNNVLPFLAYTLDEED